MTRALKIALAANAVTLFCLLGILLTKDGYMVEMDETRPLWYALELPNLIPWLVVGAISLLIGFAALLSAARTGRSRKTANAPAAAGL
jgi:hypothetical protein